MNPWQMAQQLKHELQTVTWADGSAEVVFGTRSVCAYANAPIDEENMPLGFPFALVTIDSGTPDENDPELIEQNFTIITAAEVAGDPLGEHAIIGGSRADLGKSAGAGIGEVSERVRYAVQNLTGYDGAKIIVSSAGLTAPSRVGEGRHIVYDEVSLLALCTSQPHYAAPQNLAESGDTWTWSGAHCSSRFDFLQFRLGYVAGASPAETPSGLDTTVYTGTALTHTHSPVSGKTYSIFAEYDPRGTGAAAHYSSGSRVGSYKVVA